MPTSTFPDGYTLAGVPDFDWSGSEDLKWAGDAQSIPDKDWAISHLVEVQEGLEMQNYDQAWHNCLMLLSAIGMLSGRIDGPLVVLAPTVNRT